MADDNDKLEGMLRDVLTEESSLKKISISVASAVLAASIIGSIVLYKEFIHIQDWAGHHEEDAQGYVERVTALEDTAAKGGRWTLEDHNKYAMRQENKFEAYSQRIGLLERSNDLMEFKLDALDDKLDEIIEAINNAVTSMQSKKPM